MPNKVYGLFRNSYDFHSWHDLVAASEDQQKLIDFHDTLNDGYEILSGESQAIAEFSEGKHYQIEEIIFL